MASPSAAARLDFDATAKRANLVARKAAQGNSLNSIYSNLAAQPLVVSPAALLMRTYNHSFPSEKPPRDGSKLVFSAHNPALKFPAASPLAASSRMRATAGEGSPLSVEIRPYTSGTYPRAATAASAAAAAGAPPTTPSSPAAAAPPGSRGSKATRYRVDLSESEVLYGSTIMIESMDGWFLTAHPDTGVITVREPEPGWFEKRRMPFTQRRGGPPPPLFHFRLAHPTEPMRFGSPVRLGDKVWLVLVDSPRSGGASKPQSRASAATTALGGGASEHPDVPWKSGSVLGMHLQKGSSFLALSEGAAFAALGGAAVENHIPAHLLVKKSAEGAGARSPLARFPSKEGSGSPSPRAAAGSALGAEGMGEQQRAQVPSLAELREFLTASSGVLAAKASKGSAAGPSAAAGAQQGLPRVKDLRPVDPADGLVRAWSATTAAAAAAAAAALSAGGGVDEGRVELVTSIREDVFAQQAKAQAARDRRCAGNILDRLPGARLGLVLPVSAWVPVQRWDTMASEGGVGGGGTGGGGSPPTHNSYEWSIHKDERDGEEGVSGGKNRFAKGLGTFTLLDGKLALAGPGGGSSAASSSGRGRSSEKPVLINQSCIILGQSYLYVTCDRARGSTTEVVAAGASPRAVGVAEPAPSEDGRSQISSSNSDSSKPQEEALASPGSPTSSSGGGGGGSPAAGAAADKSVAAGDSCRYVTQAGDGCSGGNRREVFVAAEEVPFPKGLEPGEAAGGAGGAGSPFSRGQPKPVYDRRAAWRIRILVPIAAADSRQGSGAAGAAGEVGSSRGTGTGTGSSSSSKKRPSLASSAPATLDDIIHRTDDALQASRVLRLGKAALRPPAPPDFDPTAPARPAQFPDWGDDTAAANVPRSLERSAAEVRRSAEIRFLGHERLKLTHGLEMLSAYRAAEVLPQLRKDRAALRRVASRAFAARMNTHEMVAVEREWGLRSTAPLLFPKPLSTLEKLQRQEAAAAAAAAGGVRECLLCAPLPASYNPSVPSPRYAAVNLCRAHAEFKSGSASESSRGRARLQQQQVQQHQQQGLLPGERMRWGMVDRVPEEGAELALPNFADILRVQDVGIGVAKIMGEARALTTMLKKAIGEQ